MVDSKWLFPESAEIVASAHGRYFRDVLKSSRNLTYRELQRYGDYPAGWRARFKIAGKSMELDVLLAADAPFSEPRIALASDDYYLLWPHVEREGLLCLRGSADTIDHSAGVELTVYYVNEAVKLIEDSLAGKTTSDFVTEFGSYWNRWITLRKGNQGIVWMLTNPAPPSRILYCGNFKGVYVVTETQEMGVKWAKAFFNKETVKSDQFEPALFMWLNDTLTPMHYPKHNGHVANLARNCGCFDMLISLVPDQPPGEIQVVFGFDTKNGLALGATRLTEPIALKSYKAKPVYLRLKGNRPKTARVLQLKKRYFSVDGKVNPMKVQRIDREWIFERGGSGLNPKINQAKVCLIGCGSLGAQVAKYIVQSGVRRLVLVDPDLLSWDNIGRHLLGADSIEKNKASGLKKYLEAQFPDMLEIDPQPHKWQELIADEVKKNLILKSDIVISTIGDWDAEAALNYAFNSYIEFPPVIFGWTEPFGVAGHALSITGLGGCLACGMNLKGRFKYTLAQWPAREIFQRAPACGETYQPYGIIDIAPTQAMIARLSVNVILGTEKAAVHHAWIGRLNEMEAAGGAVWEEASSYYGALGAGGKYIEKQWLIDSACHYRH